MRDVFIVGAKRTGIGKFAGPLKNFTAADLGDGRANCRHAGS